MNNKTPLLNAISAALLIAPSASFAADAFFDALSGGKASGNFRLRYEDVAVTSPTLLDSTALTLRTRLGYETAPLEGFTAFAEFEDTHILGGQDEYAPHGFVNEKRTGYTRALIVDPEQTEINQAYIRYRGVPKLDITAGRQRILLDNQRFIGNVGWRQNEQTYEGLSANYKGIPDWNFYYAYIDRVQGIAKIQPNLNFNFDSNDHLLNVAYSGFVLGKLIGYHYQLENEEPASVLTSTTALNPGLRYKEAATSGLRFEGNYALPTTVPLRLLYTAEYAQQSYTNAANLQYDTAYSFAEAGMGYVTKIGVLSARVAYESMGADDTGKQAFQTPYATKHAFMGWDDMFLVTPASGLTRTFATLAGDFQPYGVRAMLVFHNFSKDVGNGDYGSEVDAQVLKTFGSKYTLGVKYADYSADKASATIDTKKYWVFGEMAF